MKTQGCQVCPLLPPSRHRQLCRLLPRCAAPRVRFPSAHNERGNIYSVARAHLIFMGRLFIDGERLLLMGRGEHVPAAPKISGVSPSPGAAIAAAAVPPPCLGAGASGHAWLRSFAVEGSGGDYKICR